MARAFCARHGLDVEQANELAMHIQLHLKALASPPSSSPPAASSADPKHMRALSQRATAARLRREETRQLSSDSASSAERRRALEAENKLLVADSNFLTANIKEQAQQSRIAEHIRKMEERLS